MNSKHTLYNSIVKYSLDNDSTVTASENIRYLMSKYGIYEHEWHQPISICTIYNKINKFVVICSLICYVLVKHRSVCTLNLYLIIDMFVGGECVGVCVCVCFGDIVCLFVGLFFHSYSLQLLCT